jgi:bifunctional non-homologous end joining protein LigD
MARLGLAEREKRRGLRRGDAESGAHRQTGSARTGQKRPKEGGAGKLPAFRALQLATAVDAVPKGAGWMHEIKYDGYRCLIAVAGPDVKSIRAADWTGRTGSAASPASWPD